MKAQITTVTLPDAVWSRGGGSKLLTVDDLGRHQCCIGVACTALGLPDETILNITYAHFIDCAVLPNAIWQLAKLGRAWADERTARDYRSNELPVYWINDRTDYQDDETRVIDLNVALEQDGVPLRFRLDTKEARS